MPASIRSATAVWLFAMAFAAAAPAADTCVQSCKAETATCVAQRCRGLHGAARSACRETCRGIGGCASIRTLAYVNTVCRTDANGSAIRQTLKIRRGNCAPVTVLDLPPGPQLPDLIPVGSCKLYGETGVSTASVLAAPFQRLVVSPDARSVVFEVSNGATFLPSLQPVDPALEGMWYVRSDGEGLRRLGPPSRYPRWLAFPAPNGPLLGLNVFVNSQAVFSPNSRMVAYSDLGPGPTGEEAPQIWLVDLESGARRQLTHLAKPPERPGYVGAYTLFLTAFLTNDRVAFINLLSLTGGLEPSFGIFTVKTDGGEPEALPLPEVLLGSRIDPTFTVIGPGFVTRAVLTHPDGSADLFLFRKSGKVLQLTNLHSRDLREEDPSPNGRRFLFITPEDPLGTNPSRNCQVFSVNDLGAGLRQLTHFKETKHATSGCNFTLPRSGCSIGTTFWDPVTSEIVFYSLCDPFGTNPNGGQLFAMRPDGSRLRQLTATRGLAVAEDGTVTAELPGPFRYSGSTR